MEKIKKFILNLVFYVMFFVFSIIAIPPVVLLALLGSLIFPRRVVLKRWRRAISWYGKIVICVLPFPFIKVQYKDFGRDDNREGPFIFICNHRAASDAFLMACLPFECIQIVNTWPFKLPIFGIGAKMAGYLSVKEMPIDVFLLRMKKLIGEGVNVISFPEGTRSEGKEMGQFYSSIFRAAIETKCSIVPYCISGNENKPPKGSSALNPGIIKIHKLPALRWNDYKDLNSFVLKNRVREIMRNELIKMDQK
ncbi:MAG: lysophospholipid acyltransferase family protein [Candidatus Aceula meridiana]|nr:lysophospholipid acyltransferase family protein [Candidatus Aceula meridiana]